MTLQAYTQVCEVDPTNTALNVQPNGTISNCPVSPVWQLDTQAQNFDLTQAVGFWGAAFGSVLFLYFSVKGIGMVYKAFDSAI